jgi:hypothetical protein
MLHFSLELCRGGMVYHHRPGGAIGVPGFPIQTSLIEHLP